jgi:2',3'-cyclic-nucleotide 2'-phosphodiesterase (5'-nucleotidase family)
MNKFVLKNSLLIWVLFFAAPALAQQPAPQRASPTPEPKEPTTSRDVHERVTETLIDSSIPDDQSVDRMVAVYSPKVRALDNIVGRLNGELRKSGVGAGSIGNLATDGMRAEAALKLGKPIDVAVMNGGGLRRNSIAEGELRARDIFELLPFENALVTLDLTGEQLLKLLGIVVSGREAQSGARLTYVTKADKTSQLEKAKLLDLAGREKEIDPQATYTIVTIDYLYNVGGRYSVLRDGKNVKALGITLRDAIIDYVRSETAAQREIKAKLDDRFVLDRANSVLTNESPR